MNINKKALALAIVIVILIILGSLPKSKTTKTEPVTILLNASYENMTIDKLIINSEIIAIGELDKIFPSHWNTPNGKRPNKDTNSGIGPGDLIYTDMNFRVSQQLKSNNERNSIIIRTIGGLVNGDQMIADTIVPEMNKQYLIFLDLGRPNPTANNNSGHYLITGGGFQGMYEIVDEKAISRNDEWLLEDLIAYIQKVLSDSTQIPTELIPTETQTPSATITPEIIISETETPIPTETITPTP